MRPVRSNRSRGSRGGTLFQDSGFLHQQDHDNQQHAQPQRQQGQWFALLFHDGQQVRSPHVGQGPGGESEQDPQFLPSCQADERV